MNQRTSRQNNLATFLAYLKFCRWHPSYHACIANQLRIFDWIDERRVTGAKVRFDCSGISDTLSACNTLRIEKCPLFYWLISDDAIAREPATPDCAARDGLDPQLPIGNQFQKCFPQTRIISLAASSLNTLGGIYCQQCSAALSEWEINLSSLKISTHRAIAKPAVHFHHAL